MTLALTTVLFLCGNPADARAETASVWRTYDLSHVLARIDEGDTVDYLLPYSPFGEEVMSSANVTTSDPMLVVEAIMRLLEIEFQYEGRSIQNDGERLMVVAPQSVQQKVERILTTWEQATSAAVDVSVDLVTLKGRQDVGRWCVMKANDAERLMAGWKDSVESSSSSRLRLTPGRTGLVNATRRLTFVRGYEVQIAENAAIAEPRLHQTRVGTSLMMRAVSVGGGVAIAACLKSSDLIGEVKSKDYPTFEGLSGDHGLELHEVARTIQSPDIAFHSTVLNSFIPEGSVLVVSSGFDLASGRSQQVIVIKPLGKRTDGLTTLRVDSASDTEMVQKELALLNAEIFDVPSFQFKAPLTSHLSGLNYHLGEPSDDATFASVTVRPADVGHCVEMLQGIYPMRQFGEAQPLITNVSRVSPPEDQGDIRQAGDLAAKPAARSVTLTLRRPGANPAPVGQVSLPVRLGQQSGGVMGVETVLVRGYEVEVANKSTIASARTEAVVDGVAYWVRPSLSIAGNLVLDLRVKANLRVDVGAPLDLKGSYFSKIDVPSFDTLWFDERLVFADGQKEVTLGEASSSATSAGLSLSVQVE